MEKSERAGSTTVIAYSILTQHLQSTTDMRRSQAKGMFAENVNKKCYQTRSLVCTV